MKNKYTNLEPISSKNIIIIGLGSTPILGVQNFRVLDMANCVDLQDYIKTIAFDAQNVEHNMCLPTVNKELQSVKLMPHEIISGKVGDKKSRLIAEKQGLFWMIEPGFHIDPGVLAENVGTGGDARFGHVLFVSNQNVFSSRFESCLRDCQDYQQQSGTNEKEGGVSTEQVIHVIIIVSFAGGTGNGSVWEVMHIVAQKTVELKINVRITPIVMLTGTLNPGDRYSAIRNEQIALKNLLIHLGGKFRELHHSNGDYQMLCQPPIFISNSNNYGEISSLNRVNASVGHFLNLLCRTQLGPHFHQEAINLQDSNQKDEYGAVKCGATIGLAALNLNKDKVIECTAFEQNCDFYNQLLEDTDSVAPQKHASEVASSLSLKETNVEDTAVQYLLLLPSLGNVDARDRAISVFRNMMGNRIGFKGCCDIYRASQHTLDNEVVKNLIPAIQEKAEQWPIEFAEALNSDVSHYLIKLTGLSEARQFLDHLRKLITRYESINQRKLTQSKKNNRSIRKTIRRYEKTFHKMQNKNCIKRALSFTYKAQFKTEYPVYIESLMRSELEITARELLYRKVYPNFHKGITNQIERLNLITKNIISAAEEARNETDRLKNLPDDFYTPVGCELADIKFMDSKLNKVYAKQGGKSKNIDKIFEDFIGRFNSLDAFTNQDIRRIKHQLTDFCRRTSLQVLWQLNIFDVFQETFPDKQHQHELICRLIRQSNGRVKVSGEADQEIPKLKYICGPDPGIVNWAVRIANEINRGGGDWRGIVIEGLPSLFFFQYRAHISVSRLIVDTLSIYQPPRHVKELVQLGESPITAVIPLPGCDNDNLDRVIAQGLVSEVIVKGKDGYELIKPLVKPKYIGESVSQIRESLSRNFADIVYINREFAAKLAKEDYDLDRRFPKYINSPAGTEPSLVEIGEMSFRRTAEIAEALTPYLSRLPQQNIRIR